MISERIKLLRKKFIINKIDGYIIPKNDEFFGEYSSQDRLKTISNFDGSAGLAIILKDKNFLFVDGRYTIQAEKEVRNKFKVVEIHKKRPSKLTVNTPVPWQNRQIIPPHPGGTGGSRSPSRRYRRTGRELPLIVVWVSILPRDGCRS